MVATFLERTRPASSMQKPAAIHITRKPPIRNRRELKIYCDSSDTAAKAGVDSAVAPSATAARPIRVLFFFMFMSPLDRGALQGAFTRFTGTNAHGRFKRQHKDFAVADIVGLGSGCDCFNNLLGNAVRDSHFQLQLGQHADFVFSTAVNFGMTLLTTEAFNFANRHPGNINAREGVTDIL